VAEMAARAQEISQEAGSKVAQAMKDVINAAAGLAGFAVESARDLVQYMVRRGQMTQEEADKLIREAEEAQSKRRPAGARVEAVSAAPRKTPVSVAKVPAAPPAAKKASAPAKKAAPAKPAAKAARPATKARVSAPKKKSASAHPKAAKKKR
jgi:polyhydroxyalkanoate synthesis regulator phasin